jgi:casein kinase II subunit beta
VLIIFQFIAARGNEYFCEIDEDYLTDRFNLTGLNTEVQYYQYALDLVTDVFDMEVDDDMREQIEKSARHLYGLVHARYVVTTRGLAKMVRFYIIQQLPHKLTTPPRWKSLSKASSANARA